MEIAILVFILLIIMEIAESKQNKPTSNPTNDILTFLDSPSHTALPTTSTTLDDYTTEQFILFKHNYLQSQQWRDKRHLVIQRDGNCKLCKATTNLEVHHLSYKHLAQEPLDELITLCRTCHQSRHDILGIPQTLDEYLAFNDNLKELL